jgi:hypothetical protein
MSADIFATNVSRSTSVVSECAEKISRSLKGSRRLTRQDCQDWRVLMIQWVKVRDASSVPGLSQHLYANLNGRQFEQLLIDLDDWFANYYCWEPADMIREEEIAAVRDFLLFNTRDWTRFRRVLQMALVQLRPIK